MKFVTGSIILLWLFLCNLFQFCINGQFLESFASSDILAYEEKLHSVFLKAWDEKKVVLLR